jgi:hypothetical protein
LPPGDRIGPYEIVEPLGAGEMGEVYRDNWMLVTLDAVKLR